MCRYAKLIAIMIAAFVHKGGAHRAKSRWNLQTDRYIAVETKSVKTSAHVVTFITKILNYATNDLASTQRDTSSIEESWNNSTLKRLGRVARFSSPIADFLTELQFYFFHFPHRRYKRLDSNITAATEAKCNGTFVSNSSRFYHVEPID